jgi:hypothetical protein
LNEKTKDVKKIQAITAFGFLRIQYKSSLAVTSTFKKNRIVAVLKQEKAQYTSEINIDQDFTSELGNKEALKSEEA